MIVIRHHLVGRPASGPIGQGARHAGSHPSPAPPIDMHYCETCKTHVAGGPYHIPTTHHHTPPQEDQAMAPASGTEPEEAPCP